MSEGHLRLVSLSILGGPLDGRHHDPEEVVAEILIGSDPGCHLVVEHPGISPIHAKVWADLNESIVYDTSAPRGVYLNNERVTGKATIGTGDVIWLGPPQEEDSVCVQCRFEPWVEVLPGASVEGYETDDAVVIEDDAAAPQDAPPAALASDAPAEAQAPEAPAHVGPAPRSTSEAEAEDDPFFVAEVPGVVPSPSPAPPSSEPGEAASTAPAADDWSFTETAAEPEPVAAPTGDEFFVAGEPGAMPEPEPDFIEASPVLEDATPELAAPQASAVPVFDLPPLEVPALPPLAAPAPPAAPATPATLPPHPLRNPHRRPRRSRLPNPPSRHPSPPQKRASRRPRRAPPSRPRRSPLRHPDRNRHEGPRPLPRPRRRPRGAPPRRDRPRARRPAARAGCVRSR